MGSNNSIGLNIGLFDFISDRGRNLTLSTGDPRESYLLFQQSSTNVQRRRVSENLLGRKKDSQHNTIPELGIL